MTATRTKILGALLIAGLLTAACICRADSEVGGSGSGNERVGNDLTLAEYRAELDRLLTATQQLDSSGSDAPTALRDLPPSWRIQTEQQDFEISAETLRRDVRNFQQEKNVNNANAIRSDIQYLRDDLDGFEKAPQDPANSRKQLAMILARPEFRDVHGPTFLDRLGQKLLGFLVRLLELLFRSSAIPTVSKAIVYGLIAIAVLVLGFLVYRQIKSASAYESAVPTELPVSARSWALWLSEARAAAAQHNWREAIHHAYWAGISFLEHQGMWRPDRARTPREYLRLLSSSSEHRETLGALTQIFELTWYAKREADAGAFEQTMQALEGLGCRNN